MKRAEIQLETITCPSCIKKIESALSITEGIETAKVLFNSSKVKAEFNEDKTNVEKISSVIAKLGYTVLSTKVS